MGKILFICLIYFTDILLPIRSGNKNVVTHDFEIQKSAVVANNLIVNGDFETRDIDPSTSTFNYDTPASFPSGNDAYTVGNSDNILLFPSLCKGVQGPNLMITKGVGKNVWCQSIKIIPQKKYELSAFIGGVEIPFVGISAEVVFTINGDSICQSKGLEFCDWNLFSKQWHSGLDSLATICFNTNGDDNSYALIDDISFKEMEVVKTNENLNNTLVKIFPNPASNLLSIELSKINKPCTITLVDIDGNILKFSNNQGTFTKWNIEDILSGTYIIRIQNESETYLRKIIIHHDY